MCEQPTEIEAFHDKLNIISPSISIKRTFEKSCVNDKTNSQSLNTNDKFSFPTVKLQVCESEGENKSSAAHFPSEEGENERKMYKIIYFKHIMKSDLM